MGILCFLLTLLADDTGAPLPPKDSPEAAGLAKTMLPIYLKEAEAYSLAVESDPARKLDFKKEPVFEWSTATAGGVHQGVIFLCLRNGQPSALVGIFSHPAEGWKGRKILHEFLALDREKLLASRPDGALNVWRPEAGLPRQEIADAGAPEATRAARLLQMRRLAKQFSGHSIDAELRRWEFRLLPTPLYRYPEAGSGVIDGALFAWTSGAGTDPEVLMLIEARQHDGKTLWEFACGRYGVCSMYMQHMGKEIWSSVLNGSSDIWWHDRLHLYQLYPEKIVSPEGKLLARYRLTATQEEAVVPEAER